MTQEKLGFQALLRSDSLWGIRHTSATLVAVEGKQSTLRRIVKVVHPRF